MALYIFNLLVGFYPNGIDSAQGIRRNYLRKLNTPIRHVFTDLPTQYFVKQYLNMGIPSEDMISAHHFLTENDALNASVITENNTHCHNKLVATEYVTDRPFYTNYFSHGTNKSAPFAILSKQTIYHSNGTIAYHIIHNDDKTVSYLFPNGEILSKYEFFCKAFQAKKFTEQDVILIDRPGSLDYMEALFQYHGKARLLVFLHSIHFFEADICSSSYKINSEYYYYFQHADFIDSFLVSTDAQAQDLCDFFESHGRPAPKVVVLPAAGITHLRKEPHRKPYSLLTVSRLDTDKHVDWIIKSVIAAHDRLPKLTLDIYGTGNSQSVAELKQLVTNHHAEEYIHFQGYCEIKDVYQNYEAYISASLYETLGLTLMEATGSGTAMIGLDTMYGNKIFIKDGENGYKVPVDLTKIMNNAGQQSTLICSMADCIVKLFSEPEKLSDFHEASYHIAEHYLDSVIEKQWIDFFSQML